MIFRLAPQPRAASSVIPVFVLLALVLTGLIVAIAGTVRLRRADVAVRATARVWVPVWAWGTGRNLIYGDGT